MPVVARVAKVRIADAATGLIFREWIATAAVQDTAAGAAVDITITQTSGGATPPGFATTLTLNLYTDTGALIRTYALTDISTSQTVSFSFTADGTAAGAARAGTVEIAVRATRTEIATYDVESDGTPNTPGTGNTSTLDRGWIRGTTTATTVLSNVALGGAKAAPAEYDESLFARTTLDAALYVARALTVAVSGATPPLSGATNSAASGNFDVTFTNVVDDRFPAAVTAAATSLTVPNATLTGSPATVLAATNDTLNVDPRLTAVHHFQVDDETFGVAKNDTSKSMLSTSTGFIATRYVTSRTASGVNGLTVAQTMDPVGPGTTVTVSSATATRDAQAGWTDMLSWTASKPGGTWNKTTDVTAPADIDADTHIVGGAEAYVLLAPDPRIAVVVGGGPTVIADHFSPGMTFQAGAAAINTDTGLRKVVTTATAALLRLADASLGAAAGFGQYLDAAGVWQTLDQAAGAGDTDVIYFHTLTQSRAGSAVYVKNFNAAAGFDTTGWGNYDIFVIARLVVDGTPYGARMQTSVHATNNGHAGYTLDTVGLALTGGITFR